MFSRSINDTSRVVRLTIVGDATPWSVILMTIESSFTIIIWFNTCHSAQAYTSAALITVIKYFIVLAPGKWMVKKRECPTFLFQTFLPFLGRKKSMINTHPNKVFK